MAKLRFLAIFIILTVTVYILLWEKAITLKTNGHFSFYPYKPNDNMEKEILARKLYTLYDTKKINCTLLFDNNISEQSKANEYHSQTEKIPLLEEYYINATRNCKTFKSERSYIEISVTEEEELFPIAYSIMLYKGLCKVFTKT